MKPDLKPPSVILLLVGLSLPVDGCPPRCQCDWKTKRICLCACDVCTHDGCVCVSHRELHSIKTLSYIDPEAFKELPNLKYLVNENPMITVYLHRNMDLEHIAEYAFYGVILGPTHLDLSETKVHSLPSMGMSSIEILQVRKTWALKALPPFGAFLHLQSAHMTFASHCCVHVKTRVATLEYYLEEHFCNQTRAAVAQLQESFTVLGNDLPHHLKNNSQTQTYHLNNPGIRCLDEQAKDEGLFVVYLSSEERGEELDFAPCDDLHQDTVPLCTPLPDALNPCEDVMSQGFLRVLVWVVSLLAISANSLVLFILLTSQQKLSVTRFLLGHLAFADSCMGMYLLLIASVDYYTHSNYYHYAISWQTGSGCQLAGILSLFASELSVYTLTAISFQRWQAIFNAMRPDRQMRLRHAAVLMLSGWLLCGTVAFLPVLGVNTYQRVSICLPMDTETVVAQFYIVSVLILNIMAFIVVCLCYLHIYCMVHNPQHDSSRCDTSMAKRMAVLIFTNFLCLAPICFYGLAAVFHQPLMTITDSKVLLVVFYPLNSCAHPFFYAILTKAFHRDILMLFSRMGLCQKQAYHSRSQFLSITPQVYRETLPGRTASQQHPKT
uniref:Thyroid stimulating hormone receptor n=1 Tax=Xiphophorus maculatus TaxID=8083 RepID=A0A3B5RAF2_XIPMA